MKTVHQSILLFIWVFHFTLWLRLGRHTWACERMKAINFIVSIGVCVCVCVSTARLYVFFVCTHACLHKSVLHLSVSSPVFPPSIRPLVLMAVGNRLKRQASVGAGREEAVKLMILHQHSDKSSDTFPPKKTVKTPWMKRTAATCVTVDDPPTLPLSLSPSFMQS